jgi:hypothetical protein
LWEGTYIVSKLDIAVISSRTSHQRFQWMQAESQRDRFLRGGGEEVIWAHTRGSCNHLCSHFCSSPSCPSLPNPVSSQVKRMWWFLENVTHRSWILLPLKYDLEVFNPICVLEFHVNPKADCCKLTISIWVWIHFYLLCVCYMLRLCARLYIILILNFEVYFLSRQCHSL